MRPAGDNKPTLPLEEFLDDLFLGCAFAAFIEMAVTTRRPPDQETTRQRAYELYEAALRELSRSRSE